MTFPKSDKIWMNGTLVPVGRRQDPRRLPRHPLRLGGLRGHPLLRDARRARPSSASTRTPSASSTPPRSTAWTCPYTPDAVQPGDPRDHRARTRWTPATSARSSTAATGSSASTRSPARSTWRSWSGTGASTSGTEALEKGVDVCVSSWTRIAPNTLPAMAKTAANYMNSQLIKMEAIKDGYAEGIALDADGYVSEGSGENLFLVKNGTLDHAAARLLGAARHHARHRHRRWPGAWASRCARSAMPARDALHRGRGLLHRHRRRDHAHPLGGQDHGRQRARAGRSRRRCRRRSST